MDRVRFYLAGGMGGLTIKEQMCWRNEIKDMIISNIKSDKSTYFFLPPYYYQPDGDYHKSELEALRFDLDRLRNSNVVIVNFNVPLSIGTAYEIAVAHEHRIPIIGLIESNENIHPWLFISCTRICKTKKELVDHIINYYLT